MSRKLLQTMHAIAGVIAPLLILAFFTATLVAEISGSFTLIAWVKRDIAWGVLLLLPTMAVLGISGAKLAGHQQRGLVAIKKKRMVLIAANGVFVLVPCALSLYWLASQGLFDAKFYAIQALELVAGPVNLALIALSIRDGLTLSGRLTPKKAAS